ncbi:CRISPR-associated protein Cas5 [Euzebya tangerina]
MTAPHPPRSACRGLLARACAGGSWRGQRPG